MVKLIIGVDVSKGSLDMTSIQTKNNKASHDSFLNKKLGFGSFLKWFESFKVKPSETIICMEHTGLYLVKFCDFLRIKDFTFSVVNPLQIKKSMGIQRVKSDKRDSWVIAQYALRFTDQLQMNQLPDTEMLKLKILKNHRERLIKQITNLEKVNGELSSTLDKEVIGAVIKDNKTILKTLKKQLKSVETTIREKVKEQPLVQINYELIQSVPGVGEQIALEMILCTHNFQRITDPRKFGSYAGVVPNSYTSGTSIRGKDRVSFFANKKIKSLLHMGALTAIKYDLELKSYYLRKVKEGKSKMSVINAVRNKLVHRMYSVVKRGTPYYNPAILN